MHAAHLWLLAIAHWGIDLLGHLLPPVLPVLVRDLGLTVARAAALATAINVSSGLLQPFLGAVVDRKGRPWMLPAAVVWCGAFMSVFGLSGNYAVLFAAALLAGLGAALFHPLASVMLRTVAGGYSAAAMSIFGLGGTVGMASSPVLAAALIAWRGLPGIRWLLLLAAAIAALLVAGGLHRLPRISRAFAEPKPGPDGAGPEDGKTASTQDAAPAGNVRALTYLAAAKFVRTISQVALLNFLPLYYVTRGVPESQAGLMLTVFLVVGSASGIASGYLSDRVGRKPVVVLSSLLATPAFIGFLYTGGFLQVAFLILTSACFYATFSVVPIYGQELVPNQPGMGAGLLMGGVWALASLTLVPLGSLADLVDLRLALLVAAWLPIASTLFMLPVPETRETGRLRLGLGGATRRF